MPVYRRASGHCPRVALAVLVLATASVASAQTTYEYKILADDLCQVGAPALNKSGQVAFAIATSPSLCPQLSPDAQIIRANVGEFTKIFGIAGQTDIRSLGQLEASLDDAGTAVFAASRPSNASVILAGNGGPVTVIADTTLPHPPGLPLAAVVSPVNRQSVGAVAFQASLEGRSGEFVIRASGGGYQLVAGEGSVIPGHGTLFGAQLSDTNAAGVLFTGAAGSNLGLIYWNGTSYTLIAPRVSSGSNSINDLGVAAWLTDGRLLKGSGGTPTEVASALPGGGYAVIQTMAINDAGQVVFMARLTPTGFVGVYSGPNPVTDKILVPGDIVPGLGAVRTVTMGTRAINDAGQIAMAVSYDPGDGSTKRAIVRADPVIAPGTLQLTEGDTTTSESAFKTFTVGRVAGSTGTVSVSYAVSAGTATSLADFVPASGVLTFGPGETAKTITVEILDDSLNEPPETIVLTLSSPGGGATLGSPSTSTLTIVDDDPLIPTAQGPFYLTEGATGFFTLDFALANPNPAPAPIRATFLRPDGSVVFVDRVLAPLSRDTIRVNDIAGLEDTALSTVVESKNAMPLVVERTMAWDRQSLYGAHGEKAGDGARRLWFFAEGFQGFFDTYILLANPASQPITGVVKFLLEGGSPITCTYVLGATSRHNVYAGDLLAAGGTCDGDRHALVGRAFGFTVTFSQPAAAERAMYFGPAPFWSGGHASAGVAAPAVRWFFAEGATGEFFDTYLLVANPNPSPATVTYEYLLPDGKVITESRSVPANSRFTVNIEAQHAALQHTAVSTVITSDLPIVAERAMYWPGPSTTWYEAHNSFGLTTIGTKWGLAEGRVGEARQYKTYILLSNPGTTPAAVTVTFLRTSGPPVVKSYTVDPTSRFNVDVAALVPELRDESFGAVIESSQEIAVERALYWNADGVFWAAGTNAVGTRLP